MSNIFRQNKFETIFLKSVNLPKKSIDSSKSSHTITRPTSSIQKIEEHLEFSTLSPPTPSYIYTDFQDFQNRIIKLSLNDLWQFKLSENLVISTLRSTNHILPKFEVFIDNAWTFSLRVYGWMLPQNHELYSKFNKSFHNVTFTNFASFVRQFIICKGISIPDSEKLLNCQKHVKPKCLIYHKYLEASFKTKVHQDEFFRSNSCAILFNQTFQLRVQLVILIVSN